MTTALGVATLADLLEAQRVELIQRWAGQERERLHPLGLGLFITRQIVLGQGGGIGVRSTLAEGTTFTVRLPRRPSTLSSDPFSWLLP